MTDYIGAIALSRVNGFTRAGRVYKIAAEMADEASLQVLEEMCVDAEINTAIHPIGGGKSYGEDLSPDALFTQYCLFDDVSLPDGRYLIRSPVARQESAVTMQAFSVSLFYIGADLVYKYGVDVRALSTSSNDWGK